MAGNNSEHVCAGREGDNVCRLCGKQAELRYWCAVCERPVAEKRCQFCGLKARRIREG